MRSICDTAGPKPAIRALPALVLAALLALGAAPAGAAKVNNYDFASPGFSQKDEATDERNFMTNADANGADHVGVLAKDLLIMAGGGGIFVGFSGKDGLTVKTPAVAKGNLAIVFDKNLNVQGDFWVGKHATASTEPGFGDFPDEATKFKSTAAVKGELKVSAAPGGGAGLMVVAGGADGKAASAVTVEGTASVSAGLVRVLGTTGPASLSAKSLAVSGGALEILGAKAVVKTSGDNSGAAAATVDGASLTIGGGAVLDAGKGGNVIVGGGSVLAAGDGAIRLKDDSASRMTVGADAVLRLTGGRLEVSGAKSLLDLDGTVEFGHDGKGFGTLAAGRVDLNDARLVLTRSFVDEAVKHADRDADVVLVSGTGPDGLVYDRLEDGQSHEIDTIYYRLRFDRRGSSLVFQRGRLGADFSDPASVEAAAARMIGRTYGAAGISAAYVPEGLAGAAARVASNIMAHDLTEAGRLDGAQGRAFVLEAGDAAGNHNWAFLRALGMGEGLFASVTGSGAVVSEINPAYAGMYVHKRTSDAADVASANVGAAAASLASHVRSALVASAAAPAAGSADGARTRLWAGGLWSREDQGLAGGLSGYRLDSRGLVAGIDRRLGPVLVGVGVASLDGRYEDKDARLHDSEISTRVVGVHAGWLHRSGLLLTLAGAWGRSDNDLREFDGRNWATEAFATTTWYAEGRVGFRIPLSEGLSLTPTVGAAYVESTAKAHDVEYAGARLLRYGDVASRAALLPAELNLDYRKALGAGSELNLNLRAGYVRSLSDEAPRGAVVLAGLGNVPVLRGVGRGSGRDAVSAGARIGVGIGGADLALDYEFRAKSGFRGHGVSLILGLSF